MVGGGLLVSSICSRLVFFDSFSPVGLKRSDHYWTYLYFLSLGLSNWIVVFFKPEA